MPIDSSIYGQLDTQMPLRIAASLDPMNEYERQAKLADLLFKQQMQPLQLQQLRTTLADAPLDRKIKQGHAEQYFGAAAEHQAKTQKMQEMFDLGKQIAALPEGHPDRPGLVLKYRMLADPTQVFDPAKVDTPFAKISPNDYTPASVSKYMQTKNYGDLVAAPKPSTHINMPAAVTPVTVQDPANPAATIIVDGRTGRTIGAGPKLTQTGTNDQKLVQALPQAKLRTDSIVSNLDRLDKAMNDLHDNPGLSNITGTIAGRTWNVTNTATGAQTDLNSIKSQIFQSSLQAMREASKTGGAVGNVSDKEGDKLERTLAGLDQSAGTDKFKENLKKAIEQVRTSKTLIKNAFDEQYGNVSGQSAPVAPTGKATKSGASVSNW